MESSVMEIMSIAGHVGMGDVVMIIVVTAASSAASSWPITAAAAAAAAGGGTTDPENMALADGSAAHDAGNDTPARKARTNGHIKIATTPRFAERLKSAF
jgi:hypothetical protein